LYLNNSTAFAQSNPPEIEPIHGLYLN